jgi:hypothetical protein
VGQWSCPLFANLVNIFATICYVAWGDYHLGLIASVAAFGYQ